MPPFIPKRHEQILADEIAFVVTATDLSDVADSSGVKAVLSANSREIDESYFQMGNVLSTFNLDDATGDDLDERAAEIQPGNIKRLGPRQATGTVVFSRAGTAGTVNIAIGTRVKTAGGVIFRTTAAGTITPSSPEQVSGHGVGRDSSPVAIIADLPGIAGNVALGTIVKFESKPPGIDEVVNLAPTLFGRDKESDDAFRQRIKDFIASLPRCTLLALETGVLNVEDPATGASVLFARGVEAPGNVTLYVDDGTGSAETTATVESTNLAATYTWNGTTTVTTADTSAVLVGDFIRLDSDGQWFEITSITTNVSVTLLNPGSLTIPTGATQSSVATGADRVTQGLTGPPPNSAVGGEETLFLDEKPIKTTTPFTVVSSLRGVLVQDTDYTLNPASGQLDFSPALTTGEVLFAEYTHFTGLIAAAQKVVDGDPGDPENFPGLRAGGVLVRVLTPTVLIQTVTMSLVVQEGHTLASAIEDAENAVLRYINGLGISGDVVRNELIARVQSLASVADLIITAPSTNIPILDDQIARTTIFNVTIT